MAQVEGGVFLDRVLIEGKKIRSLQEVTADLEGLVLHWDQNENIPPSQVSKARAIGVELHAIGGMSAMREAYYSARRVNLCANALNVLWHNIGEWVS